MPVSDGFTQFVVDQLEACGRITTRRMFGGVGVYAGDVFFALLDNDRLFLKVDDSNRGDFVDEGMGPFQPYGDDRETMGYYQVPISVLEDADELTRWARKAIKVAESKRTLKRKAATRVRPGIRPKKK
jgi:DNA transformation protein and related proteins